MIEVLRPEIDGETIRLSEDKVSIPEAICQFLIEKSPKALLKSIPPGILAVKGFRSLDRAPWQIVYREAAKSVEALSLLCGTVCMQQLGQVQSCPEEEVAGRLDEWMEKQGPIILTYCLLSDKREAIRSLADQVMRDTAVAMEPPGGSKRGEKRIPKPKVDSAESSRAERSSARLQRQISSLQARLAKIEEEKRQLQQEIGRRDQTVGDLRAELTETARKASKYDELVGQLADIKDRIHKSEELDKRENELERRSVQFEALYGVNMTKLKEHLLWAQCSNHDMGAQLAAACLLQKSQRQKREEALRRLELEESVPLSVCVGTIVGFIQKSSRNYAESASNVSRAPEERLSSAQALSQYLKLEADLLALDIGDEVVPVGALLGDTMNRYIEEIKAAEDTPLRLEGRVRYEGPQAWLECAEIAMGLPIEFTEEEKLVTGDTVGITVFRDEENSATMDLSVIERTEHDSVNDSIRHDDDGTWVMTPDRRRLSISESEFWGSGLEIGAPVSVVVPRLVRNMDLDAEPVYVRIERGLSLDAFRGVRPSRSAGRVRVEKDPSKEKAYPKILSGQKVLVIGGDGLSDNYRDVVEGMGGEFTWQSGFSNLNQTVSKVRSADIAVVVTSRVYHRTVWEAQGEAKRAETKLMFCHTLGKDTLAAMLIQEFTNETEMQKVG